MIKGTLVRNDITVHIECDTSSDMSSVLSGMFSEKKTETVQAPPVTATVVKRGPRGPYKIKDKIKKLKASIKLRRGRPSKTATVDGVGYKKAPWRKEDVLSVARILVDQGVPRRATPRAFRYLRTYGKNRKRTYTAVGVMVNDLSKYLKKGTFMGKRLGQDLASAGFNPRSIPNLGRRTDSAVIVASPVTARERQVVEA